VDLAAARFLTSPRGNRALEAARAARDVPAHRRATFLADLGTPEEVRAALVQDDLRARAGARCPHAEALLFTPGALEQATAWAVAEERASRWPAPQDAPLVDLGAGIGLDALAAALAGRSGIAFERDPVRAHLLAFNAAALGLAQRLQVRAEDACEAAPEGTNAYLDPDRRPQGVRTRDPAAFEPGAELWAALLGRFERALVKLPPGLESGAGPFGRAPREVVSLGGRARETRLFVGRWDGLPARRALALPSGRHVEGSGLAWPEARPPEEGAWLLDPDVSVVLAGLVGDLAVRDGLTPLHPRIAYLLADAPVDAAPGHWMRVDAILPTRRKAIDAWLEKRDVGNLTLRKRGVEEKVAAWRGRLRPKGPNAGTLVFTRDLRDRWVTYGCLPAE